MKTEELKSKGLSQEQIDFVMAENGKDLKALQEENKALTADRDGWKKKAETAEGSLETVKGQLKDAKETLKGFDGVDVEGFKQKISDLEDQIKKRDEDAKAEALSREQKKVLDAKFDELEIKSPLIRETLFGKVTGKDGLPFRNGEFPGLADYLSKLNEENHFYQTEDEKKAAADKAAEEEAKQKAAGSAPKFTDRSEPKREPTKETGAVPLLF